MILKEPLAEEKWRLVLLLLKKRLMPISLQPGVLLTPFPNNVTTIASKFFGFCFDLKKPKNLEAIVIVRKWTLSAIKLTVKKTLKDIDDKVSKYET